MATNPRHRAIIHGAKASNTTLAHRFGVSTKAIAKWKSRDFVKDKTSRPKTIHYALNETEREIIRVVSLVTNLSVNSKPLSVNHMRNCKRIKVLAIIKEFLKVGNNVVKPDTLWNENHW
jgi:predicted transcriptional regulator